MTDDISLTHQLPLETLLQSPDTMEENRQTPASKTVDKNRRKSIIPSSHQPKQPHSKNSSAPDINHSEPEEEVDFNTFILRNFVVFSGREDVIAWLDATEKKFNQYLMSRGMRFAALPLLIEGDAKQTYFRNRHQIKSFDDFYELLLINYDTQVSVKDHTESHSLHQTNVTQASSTQENVLSSYLHETNTNSFDLPDHSSACPILQSPAIVDVGATGQTGDAPSMQSTTIPPQLTHANSMDLDQTTHVLRETTVDNLTENLNTFQRTVTEYENLFEESPVYKPPPYVDDSEVRGDNYDELISPITMSKLEVFSKRRKKHCNDPQRMSLPMLRFIPTRYMSPILQKCISSFSSYFGTLHWKHVKMKLLVTVKPHHYVLQLQFSFASV